MNGPEVAEAASVSIFHTWGSRPAERRASYPCEALVDPVDDVYYRAVSIAAPPEVVFRGLCQLRVAPYSYDWIDNAGRQSPRTLTPGLEHLEVGQPVMTIFRLVSFAKDEHITVIMDKPGAVRLFGEIACTYAVRPDGPDTRLVVCLAARFPRGPYGFLLRLLLPIGDFVMMRKQLLTLKALAEGTARRERRSIPQVSSPAIGDGLQHPSAAPAQRDDLSSDEIAAAAARGGAFNWLEDEPEVYDDTHGENV